MAANSARHKTSTDIHDFLTGLARGLAGALLFALPMLMTMEMWSLGFYMERVRLLLLLIINIPLLVFLSHRIGFEHTNCWSSTIRDALVAFGMGIAASAALLLVLGVITTDMPPRQWVGMVAIQAVPASIGALLARSQLGMGADHEDEDEEKDADETDHSSEGSSYVVELSMMAVGALFLSLNLAPTEEMILLAYKMTPWHTLALIAISIGMMHGFVYALSFRGGHRLESGVPGWHAFIRFTLPGYLVALAISLFTLWTFERLDDTGVTQIVLIVIVLGLPAAIGAAAARLIL
ncbi:integral membrane protein TIGR02587 [Rhizobium sp. PDO1-076]|uniref:TIGR02587 family membrane protein n=1 Tax=Rhizobium sp. PDO1-076 TaxID=1125979 RepID=UPI00024E3271|nr:TIGR02587 family membrane protein [Rhizobium sp. PDO1-076]EHS51597.1 integral membrane protein TIGR02587 [Rhizobium sp. PDO1-076]